MLLSPMKNGLTSLFKEVRVFKVFGGGSGCDEALCSETKGFSVKRGEAFSE